MSGNFCSAYFSKFVCRQKKAFVCGVTQQKVVKIKVPKRDMMDQLSSIMLDYACPTTKIGAHQNGMYFIQNHLTTFKGKIFIFLSQNRLLTQHKTDIQHKKVLEKKFQFDIQIFLRKKIFKKEKQIRSL